MRALLLATLLSVACGGEQGPPDMNGWGYPRCDSETGVFFYCKARDNQCFAPYNPTNGRPDALCAICQRSIPSNIIRVGSCYLTEEAQPPTYVSERYCAHDCSECEIRPSGGVVSACE